MDRFIGAEITRIEHNGSHVIIRTNRGDFSIAPSVPLGVNITTPTIDTSKTGKLFEDSDNGCR